MTTAGTTSAQYLKLFIAKNKALGIQTIYGKDHADSFSMVASGHAAAFIMDDNILAGQIAKSAAPQQFSIVGPVFASESYAVMLPKGDMKLKALTDRVIMNMWKTGQMDALYKKWFQSPIPPKNTNLQLPPSTAFLKLRAHPTDAGG